MVQNGPDMALLKSRTVMPLSGPSVFWPEPELLFIVSSIPSLVHNPFSAVIGKDQELSAKRQDGE
jgi:hypothetical protein